MATSRSPVFIVTSNFISSSACTTSRLLHFYISTSSSSAVIIMKKFWSPSVFTTSPSFELSFWVGGTFSALLNVFTLRTRIMTIVLLSAHLWFFSLRLRNDLAPWCLVGDSLDSCAAHLIVLKYYILLFLFPSFWNILQFHPKRLEIK